MTDVIETRLKKVSLEDSLARWGELERRHRAGEFQGGFVVTVDRENVTTLDTFAGDADDPCPITEEGYAALADASHHLGWNIAMFGAELWRAGAFGPEGTPPPYGVPLTPEESAKWHPAPPEPEPEQPDVKAESLKLLGIAESHIGTARVAIDVGHLGRLHEEITRAIGALRQVGSASGASKLADALTVEHVTRMRCHACERALYAAPSPEQRGPQRAASMHLVVATRCRLVTQGELVDIREYPHVCSFTCFDKIIATWPAHPKLAEILAEHPKGRSYRNELYGVQYIGEQLLEDVADAHLAQLLIRSGG